MDKEIERRYVEAARRASSIFPNGNLEPFERPDFRIDRPIGRLGIEVTELCRRRDIEKIERFTHVAPKAKRLYATRAGVDPVSVNAVFSLDAHEMRVNDLADHLADFVYAHRNDRGSFSWDRHDDVPTGYIQHDRRVGPARL